MDPGSTVFILGQEGAHYRIVYRLGSAKVPAARVLTAAHGPYGTGGVLRASVGPAGARLCRRPGGELLVHLAAGTSVAIEARTLDWLLVRSAAGLGYIPLGALPSGTVPNSPVGFTDGEVLRLTF